jgi:hypothetical protein
VSRKSLREKERELLAEALQHDEFPWDYSYFKWQDISIEVRREMIRMRNMAGRTWMHGKSQVVADVSLSGAAQMHRKNWDGCRDAWKENNRRRQLFQYTDQQIKPKDPRVIEFERQYREREQAYQAEFNRRQQALYERWLAIRKARKEGTRG